MMPERLSPMTPTRIRAIDASLSGLADSCRARIPTIAVPAAPMPVQTAYTVPIGSDRSACDMPQKLPAIAGLDYAGHCRPALGVGGDYYDFLGLPQGHLGVAIGDVSGKGIAAALMMASLQASLRGEATRAPENLAAAVANINRLVYEASSENRYATFFYGQYSPATRKFDYVNAGHNPPMLFHLVNGQWTVTRLDIGGTVVGLLETFPYQQGCVSLAPGDLLIAYTDGISEAMNSVDEEWGEEQMMETVKGCDGLAAQDILERVFTAADQFVAGATQHDDMTLVVMRVVSQPAR